MKKINFTKESLLAYITKTLSHKLEPGILGNPNAPHSQLIYKTVKLVYKETWKLIFYVGMSEQ